MTVETFVTEAKRLRQRADASEREFMIFLRDGEALPALWQPHAPTFDRFLKRYDICEPSRYRNSCKALEILPADVTETIGMHAAVCAVGVPDDRRDEVVTEMVATAQQNGVPLSDQTARRIAARYVPPKSRILGQRSRLVELEEENRKLRKALRAKDREIAKLRKQLGERAAA